MTDEVKNVLYNAVLIAVAAVAVGTVIKKVTGMPMGAPESLKGTGKFVVVVVVGTFAVKQAQEILNGPTPPNYKQVPPKKS